MAGSVCRREETDTSASWDSDRRVLGLGGSSSRIIRSISSQAAERKRIAGDASSRSYERLTADGRSFIVMNWPAKPDGPPVKRGLPYSAIAHLAEDVKAFVAMGQGLRERGCRDVVAPQRGDCVTLA